MSNINQSLRETTGSESCPEICNPLTHDNVDNVVSTEQSVCFICREKSLPDPDCKVCHNIALYRSKHEQQLASGQLDDSDEKVNVSFPGPGIVRRNPLYGNYVVASRTIQPGELIILEKPFTIGPYSPPETLPLCLSCFKDLGISSKHKCSRCKWPVCGKECEEFYLHAENECNIFASCGVKSKGVVMNEYFSVETLRALLTREKYPQGWKRILEFESHTNARSNDSRAKAATDFIISFIRNKCNLADKFSAETIEHVVGILSINTFWAFKDLNRYASCLFEKSTLLAHDCDPNTERKFVLVDNEEDKNGIFQNDFSPPSANPISRIALRITASRQIASGEMITIRYIDLNQSLAARREELKETFYFDCTCSRCLREMSQVSNLNIVEKKLLETTIG